MARHFGYPLFGVPFCGNAGPVKREVHNLDRETRACGIYGIMAAGQAVPFWTLEEARAAGYEACGHCIGEEGAGRPES